MRFFGYFSGVQVLKADVSELSVGSIFIGRSAFSAWAPGRYPKNALEMKHGERLKSRIQALFIVAAPKGIMSAVSL
jgi:hypothetical protein